VVGVRSQPLPRPTLTDRWRKVKPTLPLGVLAKNGWSEAGKHGIYVTPVLSLQEPQWRSPDICALEPEAGRCRAAEPGYRPMMQATMYKGPETPDLYRGVRPRDVRCPQLPSLIPQAEQESARQSRV
jgi:hypothetical protein